MHISIPLISQGAAQTSNKVPIVSQHVYSKSYQPEGRQKEEVFLSVTPGGLVQFQSRGSRLPAKESQAFFLNPDSGKKPMIPFRDHQQEEFPHSQEWVSFFVLFKPSTDQMRLTHVEESSLLHLVCQLKCLYYKKKCSQKHQNKV